MNKLFQQRQPLVLMGAVLVIGLLSFLVLFRRNPAPATAASIAPAGEPSFQESRHLTAMKADLFRALLRQVYPQASIRQHDRKLQVTITGQGARASDFYNDNPYLLKIDSKECAVKHNRSKDEIEAIFTLHTEQNERFIRVPNDILYQLTEKAANAKHG